LYGTIYLAGYTMSQTRLALLLAPLLLLPAWIGHAAPQISPPAAGKLFQGLYFDEPAAEHDPSEHDVTAADVARFEQTLGTKTAWVFFSNNWFESRKFPGATCEWIRGLGKIPYIRLMLRSDLEQSRALVRAADRAMAIHKCDPPKP